MFLLFIFFYQGTSFGQRRYQFELFEQRNYFGYHFDDDFLFMANRDEQYTGGIEFELLHHIKNKKEKQGLFNPFPVGNRYFTLTFGTQLYTPYNLSDSLIILNDRPYSSYLFTSFGYTAYDKPLKRKLTFDFYLGLMGSDFPSKVQDYIHQFGDSPTANGWIHKLAAKETLVPNLRLNYQKNKLTIGPIYSSMIDWIQVTSVLEINGGLYLNAVKGGIKFSGFNHKPKGASQLEMSTSNETRDRKSKWLITTYVLPQIQLVGYNTSLQSLPWLDSPYKLEANIINRYVWIIEAGINLSYNRFNLTYLVQSRTKEFNKFQQAWHSWGGITMGFSF